MWNLGGGEIMVILLLALIVLGPQKLPEAARNVGRFTAEIRRMSNSFRAEVQAAFEAEEAKSAAAAAQAAMHGGGPDDDAIEAQARARGHELAARPAGAAEPTESTQSSEPAAGAEPAQPADEP